MNSSLQCLSHAAPLVRMFLPGAYKEDLNRDNPLGNKGELAEAFGSLLKLLWQVWPLPNLLCSTYLRRLGETSTLTLGAFSLSTGYCFSVMRFMQLLRSTPAPISH